MARNSAGIWILCDDLDSRVDDLLQGKGRTLALHLDATSVTAKSSCLALVSRSPRTLDYVALAAVGTKTGSVERRVVLGPAVSFDPPLDIEQLLKQLPSRLRRNASPPDRRVVTVPPATWAALLAEIGKRSGEEQGDIDSLRKLVEIRRRSRRQSLPEIISFERDATSVALEIFGGSRQRKQHLENLEINGRAPFISSLGQVGAKLLEDQMINHDLSVLPGGELVQRYAVGAAQFESSTGLLTIVNANRNGIERTLGVDLVYYHHVFRSFTLVQYKRLSGESGQVYRPKSDPSYSSEIERMRRFRAARDSRPPADAHSYRLNQNEFYFKLCSSTLKGFWSRMLPGMYVPLDLWELFISSTEAHGPRGGLVVSFDNLKRRFNNTEFVGLVRNGWIGSADMDSRRINDIIERELSADKSIMVASHSDTRNINDYLRNPLGQFASEDEPDTL